MLPNWLYGKSLRKLQEILNSGGQTAAGVSYSNTESGLEATNAQTAIDEVVEELDTKAALTQISNPNLLDNPWFTVNQRGESTYSQETSYGYTVDRWRMYNMDLVVGDELTLTPKASTLCVFNQFIEHYANLVGRTITASIILNGTLYSVTGTFPSQGGTALRVVIESNIYFQIAFASTDTYPKVELLTYTASSFTVSAVKLELGSVSTLAMDTAPNYATELIKCQRFYQRIGDNNENFLLGTGYANGTTRVDLAVSLPTNMRGVTPTISLTGSLKLITASTSVESTTIALVGLSRNIIGLNITGSGQTSGSAVRVSWGANSYIEISEEL